MNNYDELIHDAGGGENEKKPFDKVKWAQEKQEKRREVYALADKMTAEISKGGECFKDYLDIQSTFDRYSVTNTLLIMAQMPEATKLRDFESWKEEGIAIRKKEKGISILEPGSEYTKKDGSVGLSYNVKKVFDISQTSTPHKISSPIKRDERTLLKALIHHPPVPLQSVPDLPGNASAFYDHDQEVIFVRQGMAAADIFRSVSKELAHSEIALWHSDYNRDAADFKATCVSYILTKKNGLDVKGYDFSDLPREMDGGDPKYIRSGLSQIHEVAGNITRRMAKVLEQNKAPRTKEQER